VSEARGGRSAGSGRAEQPGRQELVAAYKAILRSYIDMRPSGIRQRIADVLGTHKSFVSLITNPADSTPIPARHLSAIAEVCHLSDRERTAFLAAYAAAHPEQSRRLGLLASEPHPTRIMHIEVPHLTDESRQHEMEDLIRDFAHRLGAMLRGK
jgi:hypothetical protein